MKTITDRLWNAVGEVAKLQYPSVAEILRKRGFGYEADGIDELIAAFDETERPSAQPGEDGRQSHSG